MTFNNEKKQITIPKNQFPEQIIGFIDNSIVYDSSCSKEATVYYIKKDCGYFLKVAPKNTLETESVMTKYFHSKGLSAEVCLYFQDDKDYLITKQINGEDGTSAFHLSNPEKLCETFAKTLAKLHQLDFNDCPLVSKTASFVPSHENTCLIHGDYCLPNIIMNEFIFTGLIDLDHAGIGDPHRDICSALWTLNHNLKTDRYNDLFLNYYGKEKIDPERLKMWTGS